MENENYIGWDSLFYNGSVVDLDVSIWTARTKLKAADLGINATADVDKALSLGLYRLAPKEVFDELRTIAAQARTLVDSLSFNFPFVRGARYTIEKNLPKLLDGLKELQERFGTAADVLAMRSDEIRLEQIPILRAAILEATKDPETVQSAINRILQIYPTGTEIRSKCSLTWTVYAIRGATSAAAAEGLTQETATVKGIVRNMVEQLRDELSERLGAVIACLGRGGKLPADTIRTTRETLDRIDEMNIFGDTELSRMVMQTRDLVYKAEQYGSGRLVNGGIMQQLAGIAADVETSTENAVRQVEENLTGLGRRRIDLGAVPTGKE